MFVMSNKRLALLSPMFMLACQQPVAPLTSFEVFVTEAANGISIHDDELHILAGNSIVVVDKSGIELRRIDVIDAGESRSTYNDIAALGDGQYVLIANNAGYRYDAGTGVVSEHFCVEPGFEEPGEPLPSEPIRSQRNDAVVVVGDTILAAPRFFEDFAEQPYENSLRSYQLNDGTPTGSVDLSSSSAQLLGMTVVGNEVIGISDDGVVRFPRQGGELNTTATAVSDAVGIASDGEQLFVIDSSATVHILPL
jgi:hypothetical protein